MKYFVLLILTLASYFSFGQSTYTPPPPDTAKKHYTVVEQMPEFPGGETALLKYIGNHISYPDYESHLGISGKAIVGFVVDEKGRVTDVKILRGVSAGLDREAIRVIRSLPDFKPGMQSGRNVKVSYVVPIKFQAE